MGDIGAAEANPITYWLEVTKLAAERLHDQTSTARKAALVLLQNLIEYNFFGDNMNTDRFEATLQIYNQRQEDYPPEDRELEIGITIFRLGTVIWV